MTVTALLGAAAGGVTLDQEDFALGRVLFGTVCQFARKTGTFKNGFAPGHLTCLARGVPCSACSQAAIKDGLCNLRIFLKEIRQLLVDNTTDRRPCLAVSKL